MFTVLVVFHVIVCVLLILVVLMQSSKGDGLAGSSFGGTLGGAVFGGRGTATFLSRATAILATTFMVMCLVLAFMSGPTRQSTSGGTAAGESAITKQAQADREKMMQQQQQKADSANPAVQITPTQSADTTK